VRITREMLDSMIRQVQFVLEAWQLSVARGVVDPAADAELLNQFVSAVLRVYGARRPRWIWDERANTYAVVVPVSCNGKRAFLWIGERRDEVVPEGTDDFEYFAEQFRYYGVSLRPVFEVRDAQRGGEEP